MRRGYGLPRVVGQAGLEPATRLSPFYLLIYCPMWPGYPPGSVYYLPVDPKPPSPRSVSSSSSTSSKSSSLGSKQGTMTS